MHPLTQTKFYLSCLNKTINATDKVDILYNEKDEEFIRYIPSSIPKIIKHLENFYSGSIQPRISIFIYPDLESMSEAFGREIKSVDWCYAPVLAEHSLVTFTSGVDKSTLTQVLVHEFSHIYFTLITGNKYVGDFKQSVPLWLDEGIALHLDSKYRPPNFPETVQKRRTVLLSKETDYFPDLRDMYTFFNRLDEDEFGINSYLAYAYSYFCVRELVDQFDEKHLTEFINKPDLENSFDQSFEAHFKFSLSAFNSEMKEKYG